MKKKEIPADKKLIETIIDSIKEKKGKKIVCLDLRDVDNAIFDYFVICHGTSTTHVSAISENVERKPRELLGVKPAHIEGAQNAQWILVDYLGIVVHIFLENQRDFYRLEDLWADGKTRTFEDD
jgi:ribosome-associated protein